MATHSFNTPAGVNDTGLPAVPIGEIVRLDHILRRKREAIGTEFLRLMHLRRDISQRIEELADQLDPEGAQHNVRLDRSIVPGPNSTFLPLSGLAQPTPGVLLFKGGRNV